jgi:hypothetical protein
MDHAGMIRPLHPGGGTPEDHAPGCKWAEGGEGCRKWSTDGTRLGSDIAHTMGTTDEAEIARMDEANEGSGFGAARKALTGMEAEQADWESDWL